MPPKTFTPEHTFLRLIPDEYFYSFFRRYLEMLNSKLQIHRRHGANRKLSWQDRHVLFATFENDLKLESCHFLDLKRYCYTPVTEAQKHLSFSAINLFS